MGVDREDKVDISFRLRLAREAAGLSQSQVAKLMGLPRPSISEMEAGRRKVSLEEANRLAELYGVDLTWLACQDAPSSTQDDDRVRLAARELGKLKPADREKVLELLAAMQRRKA